MLLYVLSILKLLSGISKEKNLLYEVPPSLLDQDSLF
jgi:hypothetical protein